MTLFHTVPLASGLVLAFLGAAQAQPANRPAGKMTTLQMPAIPDPVRVTLDPKTTALLVLDYVEGICNAQPKCKGGMLPAVTPFMLQARKGGPGRGVRHPRAEHVQVAAGGRSNSG